MRYMSDDESVGAHAVASSIFFSPYHHRVYLASPFYPFPRCRLVVEILPETGKMLVRHLRRRQLFSIQHATTRLRRRRKITNQSVQ